MFKKTLIVAALASTFAMPAMAGDMTFSSNVTLASDYLYRGLSQTAAGAAVQGGFDLSHASGAYAGVWGSSINWIGGTTGAELDTYAGYKTEVSGLGIDAGFLRYNYPGKTPAETANTNEIYGAVTYSIATAKISYSLGNLFGFTDSAGSTYMELNAAYPLEGAGVTLGGHIGMQTVANNSASDYVDYKLSVSKDIDGYVFGAAFSSTDLPATRTDGESVVVFTLTRAM